MDLFFPLQGFGDKLCMWHFPFFIHGHPLIPGRPSPRFFQETNCCSEKVPELLFKLFNGSFEIEAEVKSSTSLEKVKTFT